MFKHIDASKRESIGDLEADLRGPAPDPLAASRRGSVRDLETELRGRGRGHLGEGRARNQAKRNRHVSMIAAVERRLHGLS